MPSASTIALLDGQATPVSHDFVPMSVDSQSTIFTNREAATSAGQMQLITGFSPATSNRATNRITIRFNMPVEYTAGALTSVLYTARLSCDVVLPELMDQATRDDFAAFCKNALSDTVVNAIISDLDPVF